MSELKVNITGDASGLNRTLANVKRDASKFGTELSNQQKAENKRVQSFGNIAQKGAGLANAAGSISGIPGMGAAGAAAGQIGGALFGVKEIAENFGLKMATAAGAVAIFAGAAMAVGKALEEYKAMMKALTDQLETSLRAGAQETQTRKAYLDVLNENRKNMKESDFKRLRAGAEKNDRGTFAEIRSLFGGTKLNKELKDEAVKARIAAMPKGTKRDKAEENQRFKESVADLTKKIGDKPSKATLDIAKGIYSDLKKEHANNLAEIGGKNAPKLGEDKKGQAPKMIDTDSLSKVGLFTSAGLNAKADSIPNQQLMQLKEIATNTKKTVSFT